MSSFNIAKMRSALRSALDRVGRNNGHAMPADVGTNVDRLMHELFVASEGYSHFDKRRKRANEELMEAIDTSALDAAVTRVTDSDITEDVVVATSGVYTMTATVVKGSSRLDATKLRNELSKHLTPAVLDACFEASSTKTNPPKRIKVIPTE